MSLCLPRVIAQLPRRLARPAGGRLRAWFLFVACVVARVAEAQIPTLPEIAADRALWPREVTLKQAVSVPIVHQGREAGSIPLPAGGVFRVLRIEAARVTLDVHGSPVNVLPSQTDLLQRVIALRFPGSTAPPPAAPTPVRQPTPPATAQPTPAAPSVSPISAAAEAGPASGPTVQGMPTTPGWHRQIRLPVLPKSPVALPGVQGDLKPEAETFDLYLPRDFDPRKPSGLIVYVSPAENPDIPDRYQALWDEHRLIVIGAYRSGNPEKVERRAGLALSANLALRQIYRIDPARVFASGMSGGGRMSTRLGFMAPQYFKGVLAHCGADFYKDYHVTQKSAQKRPEAQGRYWPGFTGNQHATPGAVVQARNQTRFVLLSGPEDTARNHEDWEAALKADGFKVLLVMQPGLGHDFCSVESYRQGLEFVLGAK